MDVKTNSIPVIASRGTPWEELESRGCGLWVGNSPEELATAVQEMRGRDLLTMGARGREWMKETYSWDAVASQVYYLYGELFDGNVGAKATVD